MTHTYKDPAYAYEVRAYPYDAEDGLIYLHGPHHVFRFLEDSLESACDHVASLCAGNNEHTCQCGAKFALLNPCDSGWNWPRFVGSAEDVSRRLGLGLDRCPDCTPEEED
jgi:hypothetical protein